MEGGSPGGDERDVGDEEGGYTQDNQADYGDPADFFEVLGDVGVAGIAG